MHSKYQSALLENNKLISSHIGANLPIVEIANLRVIKVRHLNHTTEVHKGISNEERKNHCTRSHKNIIDQIIHKKSLR